MIEYNFLETVKSKIDKIDRKSLEMTVISLIDEINSQNSIFNSMSEAVIVFDTDKKVHFFNKFAQRLLRIPERSMHNAYLDDIILDTRWNELLHSFIDNNEIINNFELFISIPFEQCISMSIEPLYSKKNIEGVVLIIEDITRARENEKKLRQTESLASLTTFAAGIAHEIKNPLGAMSIHVQLLEREMKIIKGKISNESESNLDDSIAVIKDEIDRLNNIVHNFLFTVRPLQTELDLVKLDKYLDEFCKFISPELEEKGIILKKQCNDLPQVWLDKKYFKHVLLNLVKNAIDAIRHDNGIITISASVEKNYVYIEIKDNGMGIPEEIQPKIFDPYYTSKNFGTGLGLTMVYKIVKEHKGDIRFVSKNGETSFIIQLPLPFTKKEMLEYTK